MFEGKLEFDLDKMNLFKEKVVSLQTELGEQKGSLEEYLETLKEEWHTNAGEKFFEEDFSKWKEHVDLYLSLLETLNGMISKAIEQYSEVRERAGGSAISC